MTVSDLDDDLLFHLGAASAISLLIAFYIDQRATDDEELDRWRFSVVLFMLAFLVTRVVA